MTHPQLKFKYLFFLILSPANLGLAEISCGITINAASCSEDDISATLSAASRGDTVVVPGEVCTWERTLIINKGIILKGAGIGNTIIANNVADHGYLIAYNPSDYSLDAPFRISGFTFDLNNNGSGIYLGEDSRAAPFTMQTKLRIDHNHFCNVPSLNYVGIKNKGLIHGVVDNNVFDSVWTPARNDPGLSQAAAQSWYRYFYPLWDVGNGYSLIYEDNAFTDLRDGENNDSMVTDGQYGCRYVFRYNTISLYKASQNLFDLHGYDAHGGPMYGCFGAEIYGNKITALAAGVIPATDATVTIMADRSGKAMVFYNSAITQGLFDGYSYNNAGGASKSCPSDYIDEQIIHDTYIWSNKKMVLATWMTGTRRNL